MKIFISIMFLALLSFAVLATQYPEGTNHFSIQSIFHLNSSTGTTAVNSLGTGDGTLVNTEDTDWIPGYFGNAIDLDGSNEYLNTNTFNGFGLCDAYSIGVFVNSSDTSGNPMLLGRSSSGANLVAFDNDPTIRVESGDGSNQISLNFGNWDNNVSIGKWSCLVLTKQSGCSGQSMFQMYVNGSNLTRSVINDNTLTNVSFDSSLWVGARNHANPLYMDGAFDEVLFVRHKALSEGEIQTFCAGNYTDGSPGGETTAPTLSAINCTSCNIPFGDSVSPYSTTDTTPTFTFATDVNANCRIDDDDLNFTSMGNSRNCDSVNGTTQHICTLKVQDELVFPTDYIYLGCQNSANLNESALSSSGALQVGVENLTNTTNSALDSGIQHSVIWPGAIIYSDQQVYLRNSQDQQVLATVDRVALYGAQRWLLNVEINASPLGLFNLSPAVYVLDMVNLSSGEIERQVSALINSTKR